MESYGFAGDSTSSVFHFNTHNGNNEKFLIAYRGIQKDEFHTYLVVDQDAYPQRLEIDYVRVFQKY